MSALLAEHLKSISIQRIPGIDKERLAFLLECNFNAVNRYELVLICKYLNIYIYQFEEQFNLTLDEI